MKMLRGIDWAAENRLRWKKIAGKSVILHGKGWNSTV